MTPPIAMVFTGQIVFAGVIAGLVYGVLGVGLLLVYRSSRVINFAYGQMGALAATFLAKMVLDWGWNYWIALVLAMAGGALLGALIELGVVRRLFTAPRVILFIATLGVAQLVFVLQIEFPSINTVQSFPTAIHESFTVAGIFVDGRQILALVVIPITTLLLAAFLAKTRTGQAIRAAASNPDAARLAGVRPKRMSTIVWALAGALSALTAILIVPLLGLSAGSQIGDALGPSLLVRALAAVLIARMVSLPMTLVGGVLIGVVEALLLANVDPSSSGFMSSPGVVDLLLFVFIVLALLFASRRRTDDDDSQAWSFTPRVKPIPSNLRGVRWVTWSSRMGSGIALAVAVALPLVFTQASRQFLWTQVLLYAAVALSVVVLTGFAGQLSLSQFAFVGLGALSTAALVNKNVDFLPAVLLASVVCIVAAMLIGAPALRLKGWYLAITTLAFAVACSQYIFGRPVFMGDITFSSVYMPRQTVGPLDLTVPRTYYFVCLGFLVLALLFVHRLRRSGIGRAFVAVRANEANASAFGTSPTRAKLMAFGIAGGLAGLAGSLFGGLLVNFGPGNFTLEESIQIVAIAVIGGVASPAGAVLGALWVIGLPALFGYDATTGLLTSGLGLLVLLMYFPGGLSQIFYSLRDALFAAASKRHAAAHPQEEKVPTSVRIAANEPRSARTLPVGTLALRCNDVSVHFGGVAAVDGVSITVAPDEIVGLIGANGAGKTTLMNVIGGYVASSGTVELFGKDISGRSPAARARLGLGRAFQNALLFSDLTVKETVMLAFEAHEKTRLLSSTLGLPRARRGERHKERRAAELIDLVGLGRYQELFVSDLSTGTRRICELACLLALDARVLCLDEPTAGIAQRETEAFGPLLRDIQSAFGCSMLVIEHDMPMVMALSDRVYCLDTGAVIAEGSPSEVRNNPLVIAAYLGTDERTINRSDTTRPAEPIVGA